MKFSSGRFVKDCNTVFSVLKYDFDKADYLENGLLNNNLEKRSFLEQDTINFLARDEYKVPFYCTIKHLRILQNFKSGDVVDRFNDIIDWLDKNRDQSNLVITRIVCNKSEFGEEPFYQGYVYDKDSKNDDDSLIPNIRDFAYARDLPIFDFMNFRPINFYYQFENSIPLVYLNLAGRLFYKSLVNYCMYGDFNKDNTFGDGINFYKLLQK